VLRKKITKTETPPNPVQNLEEILGDPPAQASEVTPLETIPIANNEAISNYNSPIINEEIQHTIDRQANEGKIELPVDVTDEQRRQQESLSFGTSRTPAMPTFATQPKKYGTGGDIGFGTNSHWRQAELIEMKRLQG